jgi:HEAT repeat protein
VSAAANQRAALGAIEEALSADDFDAAVSAVWAFAAEGDEARDGLRALLVSTSVDEFVRREIVLALQDLRDADALIGALVEEGQGWVVRSEAALALATLGEVRAVEPLLVALEHAHERVREEAAHSLGLLGDARAAQPLFLASVNDQDRRVRKAAEKAHRRFER